MKYIIILFIFSISIILNINALNTEEKLAELRKHLDSNNYDAYIIPSEDEHQSEYVSAYDKRRAWISGFTGSAGVAVVTKTKAALWTDSRYYIEAEQEIDTKFWSLMKASEPTTQKIEEWLKSDSSIKTVAQNSKLTSIKDWQNREAVFKKSNINFVSPEQDLIDLIWTTDRPSKPNNEVFVHEIQFAGKLFSDKLNEVKNKIKEAGADVFVVTALDEIAWLFNLRGSDIPYNPMFFSYAIVNSNDNSPHQLFINQSRTNFENIKSQLKISNVEIKDYDSIKNEIKSISDRKIVWISLESSFYIYNAVENKQNMINLASPIRSLKAVKNDVEMKVTRECQIRDSVARIKHMHWLETEIKKGTQITEKTAAEKLKEFQSLGKNFKDLSFNTISAVGSNAAKVHYSTDRGTNEKLTVDKVYLLDAGAQYLDCTTDITRTHHYGQPTVMEKLTYTKVMQGSINMAKAIFPPGLYGRSLDIEARAPLWNLGLDYGHGTGHGIGHFLSVHENPPTTSYNSKRLDDEPFAPGMITSDEPGYYQDGQFGIRLETDLEVVEAITEHKFRNRTYLKFNPLSLVPFERNLIDSCLLTLSQVDWLNAYYDEINLKLSPMLDQQLKDYLSKKTEKFKYSYKIEECENYFSKSSSLYSLNNYLILMIIPITMLILD